MWYRLPNSLKAWCKLKKPAPIERTGLDFHTLLKLRCSCFKYFHRPQPCPSRPQTYVRSSREEDCPESLPCSLQARWWKIQPLRPQVTIQYLRCLHNLRHEYARDDRIRRIRPASPKPMCCHPFE